jgi:uncharacterized protein YbjQ (UPF0145 family)
MFRNILQVGTGLFFVIALIGASMVTTIVLNTQQVVGKSSDEMGEMLKNMSKMGVVITSTPIMCTSMGDILQAVKGMAGGNLANMTSMGNLSASAPETMKAMMNKTGSLNQTNDMQGMLTNLINKTMVPEAENMTDSILDKVKDLMLCSPTSEKDIKKMLK